MQDEVRRVHEANRAAWNEAAARYTEWHDESVAFLRGGGTNFEPPEREFLGDLRGRCRRAIHLQCASGKDTLSLWNLGAAEVVGIDISDVHIANAKRLAAAVDAPARFERCDVLATPAELDGTADLVYTGRGALCWLADINAWAKVVARLLAPGGRLYVFEGHPLAFTFDMEPDTWVWRGVSYFGTVEISRGWPSSYVGTLAKPDAELQEKYDHLWNLGDVVNAVIDAGLRLERLAEHPDDYWKQFPNMPEERARMMPRTFSLLAVKP